MTMEAIKELRARTNLGMTDCKKALAEASGNIDAAIEILQKKGLRKVDDLIIPLEGAVQAWPSLTHAFDADNLPVEGYMVEVNCQTDFGARSQPFQEAMVDHFSKPMSDEETAEILKNLSKQLGEKVVLRRSQKMVLLPKAGWISSYNHQGGNIAVLLSAFMTPNVGPAAAKAFNFTNELAMHIAAMKPLGLRRESIMHDVVEKKRAFFADEVKDKKPEFQEKIIAGKMDKWFAEVALMEQESIMHPKRTVQSLFNELQKEIGEFSLGSFIRYERGESINGDAKTS